MRNRTKAIVVIAIFAAAVVLAASCNIYFIREYGIETVLWNDSEAYLLVSGTTEGHYLSYLRYPWFLFKQYFGAVEPADDERGSLSVIRVTSSGLERHILRVQDRPPGVGPLLFTPMEGRIYANYPALGGLCWLAGDHFEPATPEERQRLDGTNRLTSVEIDHGKRGVWVGDHFDQDTNRKVDNAEKEWSKRSFPAGGDYTLTFDAGDKFRLLVKHSAVYGTQISTGIFSIDLLRPGQAPQRIWNADRRPPRWVSRTEYKHTFQDK